jgi:DNA repair exonuclease SbcCD nuclease subunit
MKIALINDTHFGARNDNPAFAAFFKRFYDEVFFPTLDARNIKQIIHLGDVVDRRKYINYVTARNLRTTFIEPALDRGIKLDIIIGNHDTFYKNTNEVNSIRELYDGKDPRLTIIDKPLEKDYDGTKILLLPWIATDMWNDYMEILEKSTAQVLFGHLEISGFQMYKGQFMESGLDSNLFQKFDLVASGHYHHKSFAGNIQYLGAPYEMTWADFDDPRGFHIFDTATRELEWVMNPIKMFYKIHYDDADKTLDDVLVDQPSQFKDKFVKVIVRNKTSPYWFDMYIDHLEKAGVMDLNVVDDHFHMDMESDDDIVNEAEDTLTILRKSIDSLNTKVDRKELEVLLRDLYNEALRSETL